MSENNNEAKAKWVKQVTCGQYTGHFSEKGYFKLTSPDLKGGDTIHCMFSGKALAALIDASETLVASEEVYRTEIGAIRERSKAELAAKSELNRILDKQIKAQQATIEVLKAKLGAENPAVLNMESQLFELFKARAS